MDCKLLKLALRDHSTTFHPSSLSSENYKTQYFPLRSLQYTGGILHRHIELLPCDWLFDRLPPLLDCRCWEPGQCCSYLTQGLTHSRCSINEWVARKWSRNGAGRLKVCVWDIVWSRIGLPKQQGRTPGKGDSWSCIEEFLYSLDWEGHHWVSSRSMTW